MPKGPCWGKVLPLLTPVKQIIVLLVCPFIPWMGNSWCDLRACPHVGGP